MANTGRRVSLLAKDLCSYAYVHDQYLANGGLPELPWLAERRRTQTDPQQLAGSRYA
jgi:hypothetical protein